VRCAAHFAYDAFAESFNGKVRAECLNANWFLSLADARRKCEAWRVGYNKVRPHSSIGHGAPIELANAAGRAPPTRGTDAGILLLRPVQHQGQVHNKLTRCRCLGVWRNDQHAP
jgi:hypothetical protein